MPQVAVASMDARINGRHGRVTYYQERDDMPAYYVTDAELAELCRLYAEQTVTLADCELIDLIDSREGGIVFM